MKITFLLLVIIIFSSLVVSCDYITGQTTSAAKLDYQMFFSQAEINFFKAPFVNMDVKTIEISYTKDWELKYDTGWLNISPKQGKANIPYEVTFRIKNIPENPGKYETGVRVESKDHTFYKTLPVTLTVINNSKGQVYDIPIDVKINDRVSPATGYGNQTAKTGLLTRGGSDRNGDIYEAGDACIIVSAEFTNNTDTDNLLLITAEGYDDADTQTSWCLSSGPLVGLADYDLPAHKTITVNLELSWTDSLSRITMQGTTKKGTTLYDITTEATPVPESEMVRILFDEEWFNKNDKDPDPHSVYITFPRTWMETGKSDSYNSTGGIELAVPRQLLLDDNESQNPDEITVRFPNAYFNGLP